MTQCPKARCALSALAVFIFMMAFEGVFHHCPAIIALYQETPNLWRPVEEMRGMFPLVAGGRLILALIITCLYKKFTLSCEAEKAAKQAACEASANPATPDGACATKKCCPYMKGACFGLKIGLFMGIMKASGYVAIPMSSQLALSFLGAAIIEGILIGVILAVINKKKACAPASCATK